MKLVFPPRDVPTVPIVGLEVRFPVHHVFCVTRNYDARAAQPGGFRSPEEPAIFTKQPSAVIADGGTISYPPATTHFEPETELVVAIGSRLAGGDLAAAKAAIYGYAVGLDMTRRDLQKAARSAGKPWDTAKWFEGCAPVSAIRRASDIGHPVRGAITLDVNGKRSQEGDLSQMMWPAAEVVALVSRYVTLEAGDLLFTGTPSGEVILNRGDRLAAVIAGVGALNVEIV